MRARPPIAQRVAACLLLIALTACTATAEPAPSPAATAPAAVNSSGVTLVLWHGWSGADSQALGRLVKRFNQQHLDGQVILQTVPLASFDGNLRGQIASGSGPHLVLLPNSWIGGLAHSDLLLALDSLLSPAEPSLLLPATVGGARARGVDGTQHLYGLPISFDTLALYYNTANVLTPPADTAELITAAHGLGDPGAPRWGLALNLSLDNTIGYLYAADGRIFDDAGKLVLGGAGRAGAEQWLTWLLQLKNDTQLLARADSSIRVDRELKDGHVIMTFDWAHQLRFYRSLWGSSLGVAPLPRLSATNQPPRPYVRSDVLAINARVGTNERRAALEFLRFMIGEEAQRELLKSDIQPARKDLKLEGDDLDKLQIAAAQAFRSQAEQGQPMPNLPTRERDLLRRELERMQRQVLLGETTPADAVTETDKRLRELLGISDQ